MKKIILLVLSLVAIYFIGTTLTIAIVATRNKNSKLPPALELVEHNWCNSNLSSCKEICGVVVNNTNTPKRFPMVRIKVYDKDNNVVHEHLDTINELSALERWRFKIRVCEPSVVAYKITEVTHLSY